jgi:hypothetical protein
MMDHIRTMRDDRYRGTSLPRRVRKLCRMGEREADRAHPDRLRRQAVVAFVSEAEREISPEFRRRLRERETAPSLFGAHDIAATARTGLVEIARDIDLSPGVGSTDAVSDALRRRGEGYAREQKCRLVADRRWYATIASESVKKAFDDGAPVAATLILASQSVPKTDSRVQLTENLVRPTSGVGL